MDWKVRILKRAIDLLAAVIGLVLAAPLFPILAIAIKWQSQSSSTRAVPCSIGSGGRGR
jgi:lipopolysaccharide/colanic/teichoic acid biosynthesis glycosyltransferase